MIIYRSMGGGGGGKVDNNLRVFGDILGGELFGL